MGELKNVIEWWKKSASSKKNHMYLGMLLDSSARLPLLENSGNIPCQNFALC